jgi:ribosomal protein L30E
MEQKDFVKILTKAIVEKKLVLGTERTFKALKAGKLSAVGHASNTPEKLIEEINASLGGAKLFSFSGNNVEFGELCKRPHRVSVVGIIKE